MVVKKKCNILASMVSTYYCEKIRKKLNYEMMIKMDGSPGFYRRIRKTSRQKYCWFHGYYDCRCRHVAGIVNFCTFLKQCTNDDRCARLISDVIGSKLSRVDIYHFVNTLSILQYVDVVFVMRYIRYYLPSFDIRPLFHYTGGRYDRKCIGMSDNAFFKNVQYMERKIKYPYRKVRVRATCRTMFYPHSLIDMLQCCDDARRCGVSSSIAFFFNYVYRSQLC